MIDHYNAFISYRHVPRDISVAEEVQRQLERFPIPAAIRKSTGISKIERIFRDKDELPISANLSDDIDYALKHNYFINKTFTVFTKPFSEKKNIAINCGARACMGCLKCYCKNDVSEIHETLK